MLRRMSEKISDPWLGPAGRPVVDRRTRHQGLGTPATDDPPAVAGTPHLGEPEAPLPDPR